MHKLLPRVFLKKKFVSIFNIWRLFKGGDFMEGICHNILIPYKFLATDIDGNIQNK